MNLYRIISFETFTDLLINKKEWYSNPSKWDDTYEGYLFGKLENPLELPEVIRYIHKNLCYDNSFNTVYDYFQFLYAKNNSFAQCWSKCKESDALWRIYSYGKHSIQLCSDNKRIEKAIKNGLRGEKYSLRKTEVKYDVDSNADILEKQIIQTKKTLSVLEPYFHKRKAFGHEKEYRVVILDETNGGVLIDAATNIVRKALTNNDDISGICDSIKKGLPIFDRENRSGISINVSPKEYITGVIVNPFAEDWFVLLIESMCKKYRIPFKGKSQLYEKI